ncbi:hypothetical protein [Paenibacillus sp. P36]|uniref:hypothetical protein n=1 Tax=Paenibacillus sp. P36 TaxID=3342538 RepID=UPI0038B3916F
MSNVWRSKYTYMICLLLIIIAVTGLFLAEKKNASESVVNIQGELSKEYDSVDALKQDSDLIVEIIATNVNSLKYEGLIFSITDSTVNKVYKGAIQGSSIKILENGGSYEGKEYIFEESPVLKSSESAIVFLKKYNGPITDHAYVVTGAIQGKFKKNGSKLHPPHYAPGELAGVKDIANLRLN